MVGKMNLRLAVVVMLMWWSKMSSNMCELGVFFDD